MQTIQHKLTADCVAAWVAGGTESSSAFLPHGIHSGPRVDPLQKENIAKTNAPVVGAMKPLMFAALLLALARPTEVVGRRHTPVEFAPVSLDHLFQVSYAAPRARAWRVSTAFSFRAALWSSRGVMG